MRLFRLESVRARLLALMALVLVPIAIVSLVLATTTYRSLQRSMMVSEIQVVSDYAVRARLWFRGAARTAVATALTIRSATNNEQRCPSPLREGLVAINGLQGFLLRQSDGTTCHAGRVPALSLAALTEVTDTLAGKPPLRMWTGTDQGEFRYDIVTLAGQRYLSVYARYRNQPDGPFETLMMMDPRPLEEAFTVGVLDEGTVVALMSRGRNVLAVRGADKTDTSWLPREETIVEPITRMRTLDGEGTSYNYASQLVAEPDLYVVARFDNEASRAAFTQFLVLCITPLLMLALMFATYVWAMHDVVIRWIKEIEAAARARREQRSQVIAVDAGMPKEIRLVAQAYNDMAKEADQREGALRSALEANRYLMRELNHRVKNSLQVIQSYLALSRRQRRFENDEHLIETETKVQVLSTAYRLALLDGSMRPVPLRAFAEEILGTLEASLRRSDQRLTVTIEAEVGLIVDRTIPLGLALVESVSAAGRAPGARQIGVAIRTLEDERITLEVTTDSTSANDLLPPKIMAGLAAQIGATPLECGQHEILHWAFPG